MPRTVTGKSIRRLLRLQMRNMRPLPRAAPGKSRSRLLRQQMRKWKPGPKTVEGKAFCGPMLSTRMHLGIRRYLMVHMLCLTSRTQKTVLGTWTLSARTVEL